MTLALLLTLAQTAAAWAAQGEAHLEANRLSEARHAFEQSLKQNPSEFAALNGLGYLHFSQGRFREARPLLEKATALRPAFFPVHFLLGATLVELKDSTAAVRALTQAVRLDPRHADARKLLAAEQLALGQYALALATLKPLDAGDEEVSLLRIEALQASGDTTTAFVLASESAHRYPRSAQIAAWLGFQFQFAGRYDEARDSLKRAIALDDAFPVPYQLLGDVYLKEENFEEAAKWLRQAAGRMPDDVETLLSLSRALAGLGETAGALDVLKDAPSDSRVHLQRSRLYYRTGDESRAKAEAELVKARVEPAAPVPASLRRR